MKLQYLGVAVATAALLGMGANAALAQGSKKKAAVPAAAAAAPAAQATPPQMGPAIPGVCLLSKEEIIATSVAGKAVSSRLKQLGAAVDAELSGERQTLVDEFKALDAQKTSLPADQYQTKLQQLNDRGAQWQAKAQRLKQEMTATVDKQYGVVFRAAEPYVGPAITQSRCSMVLSDNSGLLALSPAMDITPTVVRGVDSQLQPFTFERERAPAGQAPQ